MVPPSTPPHLRRDICGSWGGAVGANVRPPRVNRPDAASAESAQAAHATQEEAVADGCLALAPG